MNPGAHPDFAAERFGDLVDRVVVLVLGEPEVRCGEPRPSRLRSRDRPTPVELPVGQGEDEDVRQPHLRSTEQQGVAPHGPSADQREHQQHQG